MFISMSPTWGVRYIWTPPGICARPPLIYSKHMSNLPLLLASPEGNAHNNATQFTDVYPAVRSSFFQWKERNGWVVVSSCKMSKLPYNLTYCITINESQIKMESTIGRNYREFILAKRCTGLCTVYPATYSAQVTNEAHVALYNCRIQSLMDYCWVVYGKYPTRNKILIGFIAFRERNWTKKWIWINFFVLH